MQKIPFHIISGFLGSGKTTFLKQIIEQYSAEKKIGIIQNEFAPSNIDGAELKKMGEDFNLLEINNGSVFCVCLLGDFVRSLEKFIHQFHPDILIIEASGLSDTTSISEVISAGSLAEKIYLASNWCIVDAQNFAKVGLMKQRVSHQLRMADVVVVNKTDLVDSGLEQIEQEIRKINPFTEIKQTSFCKIDFELGNSAINKFYFGEVKSMSRPDVNSMVIKSARQVSLQSLQLFLSEWAPKAYRIKGFVKLKDNKTVAVQCTFDSVDVLDVDDAFHPTELVALTDRFTLREWTRAFKELF
ncbi:CobW family GTP-binding protein [Prolixibacteraceae bacterium Z1-6]|uniref:CobW family GTP-binding protein n=1 Tax=Draconibacterium aestuarii TaxID=2998507 RepID=A0A9X3F762_9BACT|nr:CobW family GTP-binding protein [Prolixibacteraceae bacterium Z1-6]